MSGTDYVGFVSDTDHVVSLGTGGNYTHIEVAQTPCPSQAEIGVKAAQVEDKEEEINKDNTQLEDSVSHQQRRTG